MKKVLRVRKGEPGYRPFDCWDLVWGPPLPLVAIVLLCFLVSALFGPTIARRDYEKAVMEVAEHNRVAQIFNRLTEEERTSLAHFMKIELDENGLIELKTMPEMASEGEFAPSLPVACAILCAVFSFGTFVSYLFSFNYETFEIEGKKFIRRATRDGEDVKYFLADFPDGRSRILLIIVTFPFWPVYLISWLRMRHFKNGQI